jgi:hypothetical protein
LFFQDQKKVYNLTKSPSMGTRAVEQAHLWKRSERASEALSLLKPISKNWKR